MPVRLGYGEYDFAGHYMSRFTACWRFLEAVGRLHPKLLDELADFRYSGSELFAGGSLTQSVPGTDMQGFPIPVTSELRDTEAAVWLRQLAERNGLFSELVVKAFASTVASWEQDQMKKSDRKWCFPATTYERPQAPPLDRWDPVTETKSEWYERVQDWTDDYVRELERQGFVLSRAMTAEEHFDWLARYLVLNETQREIAATVSATTSQQTVQDAISRLAKLIGLPLPPRKGRPAKH